MYWFVSQFSKNIIMGSVLFIHLEWEIYDERYEKIFSVKKERWKKTARAVLVMILEVLDIDKTLKKKYSMFLKKKNSL